MEGIRIEFLSDGCGDPSGYYAEGHVDPEAFWQAVAEQGDGHADYYTDDYTDAALKAVIRHRYVVYGDVDKWGSVEMKFFDAPTGDPVTVNHFDEAEEKQ